VSTILKALKRLDEERRAEAGPKTLGEQVLAGASAPRATAARPNKRIAIAAGIGLCLLGGAAYFVATSDPAPTPAPASPPAATRSPEEMAAAVARAEPDALPRRGAPLAGDEIDADVRRQLAAREVRDATAAQASSTLPAAGHQPEPRVGAEIPPETRLEEQRARAEALRRLAARRAGAEPARDGVTTHDAPARSVSPALPDPPRDAPIARAEPVRDKPAPPAPAQSPEPELPAPAAATSPPPALVVERTQWHPAAEKRSAWVSAGGETRELREGDVIEGAIVREIRPSSVLFAFEGEELKRGVGER